MRTIDEVGRDKHEFALFVEALSLLVQKKDCNGRIILQDEKLFHRTMTVLRLRVGQSCTFFDRFIVVVGKIDAFVGKKQVHIIIQSVRSTAVLYPKITFLLPVLKRDDYEAALYALTEVGVNVIQLVFTQKTGSQWFENRDSERAQRILVSAAEQSKNFAYPELRSPIFLEQALSEQAESRTTKIFFDPTGERLLDVMNVLHSDQPDRVVLFVGPEGDLTCEEKKAVHAKGFVFCALTPTVIRAVQAAALAAGFVRSLLVPIKY